MNPPSGAVPRITIITVVRNAAAAIAATIESVGAGKRPDVEYVVVDGASSDGTLDVVRGRADVVDTVLSEPDCGIYDAMNKGIRLARGQWLYFLNAGDRLRPGRLEALLEDLERHLRPDGARPRVVSGKVRIMDEDGKDLGYTHPREIRGLVELRRHNCIAHQATLIEAEVFRRHGLFATRYSIMGDYEYWIRLLKGGEPFHFCDLVVADFVADGISSRRDSYPTAQREQLEILTRHGCLNAARGQVRYRWRMFVFHCKSLALAAMRAVLDERRSTALLGKNRSGRRRHRSPSSPA